MGRPALEPPAAPRQPTGVRAEARRVGPVAALVFTLALCVHAASAARPTAARALSPYSGTGSWVSIYDNPAWRSPERVIETLVANGVHTLYLQTSNYRQNVDVVRPAKLARFLDAADTAGIDVVGWYLPSLASPGRDLRRALAGARFRSEAGNGFDAFALDVEATKVRSFALRNRRAVSFAERRPRCPRPRVSARGDHDRTDRQQPDLLAELPVPRPRGARRRRPADDLLHGARGRSGQRQPLHRGQPALHPRADRRLVPSACDRRRGPARAAGRVEGVSPQRRGSEDARDKHLGVRRDDARAVVGLADVASR